MARGPGTISSLEQQTMLAILRRQPSAYGISIRDELEARTGTRYSVGSIYATLDRLQQKGFLTSRTGEATAERGGKAKLYFELTGQGRQTLDASLRALDALREGPFLGALIRRLQTMGVRHV